MKPLETSKVEEESPNKVVDACIEPSSIETQDRIIATRDGPLLLEKRPKGMWLSSSRLHELLEEDVSRGPAALRCRQ
jgi:hypothetical protein